MIYLLSWYLPGWNEVIVQVNKNTPLLQGTKSRSNNNLLTYEIVVSYYWTHKAGRSILSCNQMKGLISTPVFMISSWVCLMNVNNFDGEARLFIWHWLRCNLINFDGADRLLLRKEEEYKANNGASQRKQCASLWRGLHLEHQWPGAHQPSSTHPKL